MKFRFIPKIKLKLYKVWKMKRKRPSKFYENRLETMPEEYKPEVWQKGKNPEKEYWI